jgi:hypothetical protein
LGLLSVLYEDLTLRAPQKIAMASAYYLIATATFAAAVINAQSLEVVNKCSENIFLFTQTSFGTVNNKIVVSAGASTNMGISSNWDGAVNTGMQFSYCLMSRVISKGL